MTDARWDQLYRRAKAELTENLLPWWMTHAVDQLGGFHGAVGNDNRPEPDARRHAVLFARLVWTFSSCYRVLGGGEYLRLARRAHDYLIANFWDAAHGGVYTLLDARGAVLDDRKMVYANAFAIYALAEYGRATGDGQAIARASLLADRLRERAFDPVHRGYVEVCDRDFTPNPWLRGMNRRPSDEKTMNTHLHLLEAHTCLLRVDGGQRSRVREQLYVMLNRIVNRDTHHFHYFQDAAWNPTTADVSFGHDIEGSWLMMEAAEVLGEPEARRATREVCVNIARACLDEGLTEQGAMRTEYDPVAREYSHRLSWWEQNEAVVGFVNAWQATGEGKFLDAALRCYDYLDAHFVDRAGGGWFAILNADGAPLSTKKADGFICPYHNARMCLELIERHDHA
ncbi:MAG: N-acyl-D-glucosamine 2-epimerase [Clostridiales bacterium]|nr:N-acyl-D-glucosamine 2-epimerase [Clostridiales bacterium]